MNEKLIDAIENNPNFDICLILDLAVSGNVLKFREYKYPYDYYTIELCGKNAGRIYNQTYEQYYSKDELEQYIDIYENYSKFPIKVDLSYIEDNILKTTYGISDSTIVTCVFDDFDIGYSDDVINIHFNLQM